MVDDIHIDYMYADEEQREQDELLRKKLGDKEFERQRYGIVEKDENAEDDLPVEEIIKRAQELIDRGGFIFFKFTCEYCGSRQTGIVPNTFHSAGYHCNECGKLCTPKKYGIMAIFTKDLNREQLSNIIKNIVDSKKKDK